MVHFSGLYFLCRKCAENIIKAQTNYLRVQTNYLRISFYKNFGKKKKKDGNNPLSSIIESSIKPKQNS